MKKSSFLFKALIALFAAAFLYSCDSGGSGGGSSGGGNSSGSDSTSITITIPKASQSSADINLLGDFEPSATSGFVYEIYFENTSYKSEHKTASEDRTVTFDNVKYDTYDFYLDIYVHSNKITKLGTKYVLNKTVSASNNTVQFPDMKTSDYSEWFLVKDAEDLYDAITKIASGSYTESSPAKLCLLDNIKASETLLSDIEGKYELKDNGFKIAENLFSVSIGSVTGGTVTPSHANASEGETVTLTVTPDEGKKLYSLSVSGSDATAEITPTADSEGITYTFPMPAYNVTVSAEFRPFYTITFKKLDGSNAVEAQTVVSGRYATEPEEPTKTGATFAGWYIGTTGSDGTVTLSEAAYNFSETPVTSDITLYIKWAYADFTGTFEEFLAADFVENESVSPYNIKITSATNNELTDIAKAIGLSSNQHFKGVYVKLDLSDCGATEIPDSAFWATDDYSGTGLATYLTGIVLPTGLTKINHYAFNKCSALSGSVTIPASVIYFVYQCFYDTNLSGLIYEDENSTWKKYDYDNNLVTYFSETACPTLSQVNGLWNGVTYLAK